MHLLSKFLRKYFGSIYNGRSGNSAIKQNNFERAFHSVVDYAMVQYNVNGIVVSWNRGAELMTGYTADEVLGKSLEIFYTREDIDTREPWNNLEMARTHGRFEKNAWRLKKDGSAGWANIVITAVTDTAGALTGYLVIIHDITETKKVQEQLELFSRQVDQSNDSIYILNEHFKITGWNRGAEKLYGYSREEAMGKVANELLQTDFTPAELAAAVKMIDETGNWDGEFKRKTKAGEEIYVRASLSKMTDDDDLSTGYIGVSFNITKQKKLQEQVNRLASIVEQSTDAIRSTGLDHRIITWNSGCEKLHGYTSEEAIGKTATELKIIDRTFEQANAFFLRIIEKGSLTADLEFFHKNGSSFFGTVTSSVLKNNRGEVDSLVFILKDISVRKQLEEQLKKSNEELEQKVKERTAEIYKTEKRYRSLIENNQGIVSLMDENFIPIYLSPSAERITGWPNESRMTTNSFELLHPDEIPYHIEMSKNVLSSPGKTFGVKFRMRNNRSQYLSFEGIVTNMIHDPDLRGIITNLLDVTERTLAKEAKRKTEILYSNLFENMLHGFAYCKSIVEDNVLKDFEYLAVNSEYEKMTGFKNVVGRKASELLPGFLASQPDYVKVISSVSITGNPARFEAYVAPLEKWFSISMYSPSNEYFVMLTDNITEQKHAAEAIHKSEILYRSLFENMLQGFAYCKCLFEEGVLKDFVYITVNNEYETMTGLKDLTGKKISDIIPGLLESDPSYADIISNVALSGTPIKIETYVKPMQRWFSLSFYSPEKECFVALVDDITERKFAEQEIKSLNEELEERVVKRIEQLRKTNEELEAFSYSVSHDLRAPLRGIMGFTSILEEEYSSQLDDEARRITGVIRNNTMKMGHLIDSLLSFSKMSRQDIIKTSVDSAAMVQEVINETLATGHNGRKITWVLQPLPTVHADINTIRQVWINLISNAVKYSSKTKQPVIEIGSFLKDKQHVFFVKDNGVGFDEKYRNKLFKVFQRLQGSNEFEGTGIGLAIVEKIVSKHDGQVWAQGILNMGACFYFSLPEGDTINVNTNNEKTTHNELKLS